MFKNDVICPQASSIKDGQGKSAIIYRCHRISPDKGMCLTRSLDFLGFLIGLLKHLTRHHARTLSRDADTQTSRTASYGESLGTAK